MSDGSNKEDIVRATFHLYKADIEKLEQAVSFAKLRGLETNKTQELRAAIALADALYQESAKGGLILIRRNDGSFIEFRLRHGENNG